jgi:ribonuclease T2
LLLAAVIFYLPERDDLRRKTAGENGYALAISWQPAFCETEPRRRECREQRRDRFDASHFSLHGLWPQPENNVYCGVSDEMIERDLEGPWRSLDVPRIEQSIWDHLRVVMPGTCFSLHKYEWIKHGTCAGVDIDTYYARSLELMRAINFSELRDLFAANTGRRLSADDINEVLDTAFGKGTGDRVRLVCEHDHDSNRFLIVELVLAMGNPFMSDADLSNLIDQNSAQPAACPGGEVDAAGLTS